MNKINDLNDYENFSELNEKSEKLWLLLNNGTLLSNSKNIDKLWFSITEEPFTRLFTYNMLLDYGYKFNNNVVIYELLSLLNNNYTLFCDYYLYENNKESYDKDFYENMPILEKYKQDKNSNNYDYTKIKNYYSHFIKMLDYDEIKKYLNSEVIIITKDDILNSIDGNYINNDEFINSIKDRIKDLEFDNINYSKLKLPKLIFNFE